MSAIAILYDVLESMENYYLKFIDNVARRLAPSVFVDEWHYTIFGDHIFLDSLLRDLTRLRTAVLAIEIELKKRRGRASENYAEEPVICRGLANYIIVPTVPPLSMMPPSTISNTLRTLYGYLKSFLMYAESEGLDARVPPLPDIPEVLSEEIALSLHHMDIDAGDYSLIYTTFENPEPFEYASKFIDHLHKELLKNTTNKTKLAELEKFSLIFPEVTVSIPILREYIHLVRKSIYPDEYKEDPISFMWVFRFLWNVYADFRVVVNSDIKIHSFEEQTEEEQKNQDQKQAKSKKKEELPYRAIIFTNADCPVCKTVLSSRDLWILLGRLQVDKGVKTIIVEHPRFEADAFFYSCYIRIVPSFLYKLILVHGISPHVTEGEVKQIDIRKLSQIILSEESPLLASYEIPGSEQHKLYPPSYNLLDGEYLFNEIIREGAKEAIFQKILNA